MQAIPTYTLTDCLSILEGLDIPFTTEQYYYRVGVPTQVQGWLLHVSVVETEFIDLAEVLLPLLKVLNVPFKIARDFYTVKKLNQAYWGIQLVGKIITVYPADVNVLRHCAEKIIEATAAFEGPAVPTDFHLGSIVFARYGSFNGIVGTDLLGNQDKLIINTKGQQVKDIEFIPPLLPEGINNPFPQLIHTTAKPRQTATDKLGLYLVRKILKTDVKGNVYRCLSFKGLSFKKVLIKEGNKNQLMDDYGRDMISRLKWQKEAHERLAGKIPIPAVLDYFEQSGNAYLVFEYIKGGEDLTLHCFNLANHRPWFELPPETKELILSYLFQVLDAITVIHEEGFVHRDISGTNFLVTEKGKIHLIDLELLYDLKKKQAPLKGFTAGFASPAQFANELPTTQDDIYAIGALLLSVMIPIWPSLLIEEDPENLSHKLEYFTHSSQLTELIITCLDPIADHRPGIPEIKSVLENYGYLLHKQSFEPSRSAVSKSELKSAISLGLTALQSEIMMRYGLWVAPNNGSVDLSLNPFGNKAAYNGLYNGTAGILYLFSEARKAGFSGEIELELEREAWERLVQITLQSVEQLPVGLYYGGAGIAVAVKEAHNAGILAYPESRDASIKCLGTGLSPYNNLIHGKAGQGLALLQCEGLLRLKPATISLVEIIGSLISDQQKDGSWIDPASQGKDRLFGFGYGNAGIVYFLLEAGFAKQIKEAIESGVRGLEYLARMAQKNGSSLEWPNGTAVRDVNVWWCTGGPGIALSFLKGYEVTGNSRYKDIAERALSAVTGTFLYHNLGQCHGLSGLGEIYLEAFQITNNERWLRIAEGIAGSLCALKRKAGKESCYWLVESADNLTAEFMTGNSGILHFLMRCYNSEQVGFPFINNSKK